jgi:hypothetical protein
MFKGKAEKKKKEKLRSKEREREEAGWKGKTPRLVHRLV